MGRRHHTTFNLPTSPISSSSTGAGTGNAVSLDLGDFRRNVELKYDVATTGTLVIEVSTDNSTWRTYENIETAVGGEANIFQYTTAYRYTRAYADSNDFSDANITLLELVAKGL